MSQTLARLSLVFCAFGLLAQPSESSLTQAAPTVKVVITESPGSVTTGDQIKGSAVITLAGFSKPVNVTVLGGLSERLDKEFADVPRAIVLHSRSNGSYRLSFSSDLDLRAAYKNVAEEVRVSAQAITGGRAITGEDRKPITVLDAKEDLYFAEVFLFGPSGRYTFPLKEPSKVTLNYSVLSQLSNAISGSIKESVRITGPAETSFPTKSRQLNRVESGRRITSPYDFTFPKPGEYRVEYELTIEGGKTLRGREILFVPSPVEVAWISASPGLGADIRATAGVPFNFLMRYRADSVTEDQCAIVETLEFTGPEKVSLSPRRLMEGPGDLNWESLFEVKLVKPGEYTWKAALLPEKGARPQPVTGSVIVTPPASSGGGKTWTRADGVNDVQYLQDLKLGASSVSWTAPDRDGKSATSTLTWTEPPSTLTEGQSVTLKLSFTPWSGPSFEARMFSYAFEGGRNNMLSASANNPARSSLDRTFVFMPSQPGEPQEQATIVLQVNYRAGDFSAVPANRLYRSWIYQRGGAANPGVAAIKDKTATAPGSAQSTGTGAPSAAGAANTASLNRSKVSESVGGLKIGFKDGLLIVTEVTVQTGADIRAGDQILKINGKETSGLTGEQLSALLNDPSSRQNTLLIKRSDGSVVTFVSAKRSG